MIYFMILDGALLFSAPCLAWVDGLEVPGTSLLKVEPSERFLEKNPETISKRYSVQFQNSQYVNSSAPSYREGAEREATSLRLRIEDGRAWARPLYTKIKLKEEYSASERWNYLDVHELYVEGRFGPGEITLGRKLDNWSEWDGEWNQGVFQPRYLEDRLRSEPAGLTGLFASARNRNWQISLGALAFVPDFGPHFATNGEHFEAKNPWFHVPNSTFIYRQGVGDIHYDIEKPDAQGVAMHGGGIGKLEYRSGPYLSRWTYAYKPAPQLLLGFPSDHQVVVNSNADYMNVTIHPRIVYDRVVNWDQQWQSGPWTTSFSVAYDNPVYNPGASDWTSQQVQAATIFSGTVKRRLEAAGPHAAQVRVSILKVNGGDAPDRGRFAGEQPLFERRFQFYEGYLLGLHQEFRSLFRAPVEAEARLIYDRMQSGGAVSLNLGQALARNFRLDVELDFLGLLSSNAQVSGFLSSYRANDRLGLGMSYVF